MAHSADIGSTGGTTRSELLERLDALVDRERLTNDLVAMVQCQSVNPFSEPASIGKREDEFAQMYASMMAEVGLIVDQRQVAPGRSNVWGTLAGSSLNESSLNESALSGSPVGGSTDPGTPDTGTSRRSVMLAGHTDTVGVEAYVGPFTAKIEDGRLHGRGACDMKAALAAYLEVVRVLNAAGVKLGADLVVAGICDEEHLMLGSQDMRVNGPTVDVAIIGEPTELAVCSSHRGQVCLEITTFGKAVHSSQPHLGTNAIIAMNRVLSALMVYADQLRDGPNHPLCGVGTTNPGVIRGGSIASTVPDVCRLEIDRRTLPGQTYDDVVREVRALFDPIAAEDSSFRYEINGPTLFGAPLDTPIDHPVTLAVARAATDVRGFAVLPTAFTAATDAPNLGIPAVICGPGSITVAHTLNEYVDLDEVVAATKIYLRAVLELAG